VAPFAWRGCGFRALAGARFAPAAASLLFGPSRACHAWSCTVVAVTLAPSLALRTSLGIGFLLGRSRREVGGAPFAPRGRCGFVHSLAHAPASSARQDPRHSRRDTCWVPLCTLRGGAPFAPGGRWDFRAFAGAHTARASRFPSPDDCSPPRSTRWQVPRAHPLIVTLALSRTLRACLGIGRLFGRSGRGGAPVPPGCRCDFRALGSSLRACLVRTLSGASCTGVVTLALALALAPPPSVTGVSLWELAPRGGAPFAPGALAFPGTPLRACLCFLFG